MKKILLFCFISLAVNINAQIIYTDVTPDAAIDPNMDDTVLVDFNGDSSPELAVFGTVIDTNGFTLRGIAIIPLDSTKIIGYTDMSSGSPLLLANALNTGYLIDASASYVDTTSPSLFPGVGLAGTVVGAGLTIGEFNGIGPAYFGVSFKIGNNLHFGWVRAEVNTDVTLGTVFDYAYESSVSTGVAAGDNGSNTSISEIDWDFSMKFSNNRLSFKGPQNGEISIYNLLGEKIKTQKNLNAIDVSNYPSGLYIVSFQKDNRIISRKIVK